MSAARKNNFIHDPVDTRNVKKTICVSNSSVLSPFDSGLPLS